VPDGRHKITFGDLGVDSDLVGDLAERPIYCCVPQALFGSEPLMNEVVAHPEIAIERGGRGALETILGKHLQRHRQDVLQRGRRLSGPRPAATLGSVHARSLGRDVDDHQLFG
jgi:hypothetical protein